MIEPSRTVLSETVCPDNHLRLIEDVRHVNTNDKRRSSFRGEHGQDTRSASDLSHEHYAWMTRFKIAYIEHSLSLEEMRVLHNCISVREGSNGVFEHLLVDTWSLMLGQM